MHPVKLMIARFPFGGFERADVTDFLVQTIGKIKSDGRISHVMPIRIDDTPITMGRNRILHEAQQAGADYLMMIDNDMKPDAYHPDNPNRLDMDTSAQAFWDSSFDYLWRLREKDEVGVVAAPYCGPPPHENIYVFRWTDHETGRPEDDVTNMKLEQFTRYETLYLEGIQEVAALPTGLILMDMKALDLIDHPYTYYEWSDEKEMHKASTEDVTFTRDLSLAGVKMFCNWSAWAGHWKWKCVGRPTPITSRVLSQKFKRAVRREMNVDDGEELIQVGGNGQKNALPVQSTVAPKRLQAMSEPPSDEEIEQSPYKEQLQEYKKRYEETLSRYRPKSTILPEDE